MIDLRHSIPRAVLVHFASVQRRMSSCNCCSDMTGSRCCAIVNSLSFSCEAVVSRYLPQVRKKVSCCEFSGGRERGQRMSSHDQSMSHSVYCVRDVQLRLRLASVHMSDSLRALMYMFTREPVVTKQELDTTPISNGYDAVSGDDAGIRPDQTTKA